MRMQEPMLGPAASHGENIQMHQTTYFGRRAIRLSLCDRFQHDYANLENVEEINVGNNLSNTAQLLLRET